MTVPDGLKKSLMESKRQEKERSNKKKYQNVNAFRDRYQILKGTKRKRRIRTKRITNQISNALRINKVRVEESR